MPLAEESNEGGTAMDTKQAFENMPVAKAVLVNAVPAVLSMLVTLVYNVADTFFIGQTGDEMQVAAVSLATPVFLLFMAIGTLFGMGGTSVISRAFGEGKEDFARTVGSFCFWMSVLTGVLCILIFFFGMDYILQWIGASGNTDGYARSYLLYIAWSAPFVIISTAFSNIVRAEGKSTEAMNGVLIGTLLNIVLDPIFILWLGYGIAGAAWATVIGYAVATAYYIFLLSGNRSRLTFSLNCFNLKKETVGPVFAIGIPASLNCIMMSVSTIILNLCLVAYGDHVVAAMGVASKVIMMVVLVQLGLGQGIQPLLGYNYGARRWNRFKAVMRFSCLVGLGMGVALTLLCGVFSEESVDWFIDSEGIREYGTSFVRILLLSGPVIGILFIYINALQAVGAAGYSFLLSISRQGIIFIPCLLLFNRLFHLDGAVAAQPVADILSLLLAVWLFLRTEKKIIKETSFV